MLAVVLLLSLALTVAAAPQSDSPSSTGAQNSSTCEVKGVGPFPEQPLLFVYIDCVEGIT